MLETLILCGVLCAYPPSDVPPTYYAHMINSEENREYVGEFELTGYTWTGSPCADGVYPCEGVTVACNDSRLWHKTIYIEGYGEFYVHDTGGMANNVIDVFVGSYNEAIQLGRRKAKVYIVEDDENETEDTN